MIERILRIVKLDFSVFKEIESDPNATLQAAIVVVAANLLAAIGTAARAEAPRAFFATWVVAFVSGVVAWVMWWVVTHYVGKMLYRSGGTLESMMRVLGYAEAPGALGLLESIPCLGALAGLAGFILSTIAGIMAVSEGFDVDTGQAIIVLIIGAAARFIARALFGLLLGGAALLTYGLCSAVGR
jgi:hypothetical protein